MNADITWCSEKDCGLIADCARSRLNRPADLHGLWWASNFMATRQPLVGDPSKGCSAFLPKEGESLNA